ncbi:D-amino acid dehydrogenase [Verminephrobacter eiseniae]|uniref:D-amino acid dehydrogenase n=1 Tax=Verminephrobacter eiseniae TaxID=364317 RepID=UPI0022387DCD|nr:D-amino acid dehydrogenase [Verminephrobacter eiseniae]MCW5230389.1 D-amino acid dehydrogenase [Verminephrobacter eiseniae]MCW5292123.1 D-amino acid dehydrogenase [Verminephrobacter eiseniae]MCW8184803.1 D-amino acid dehydrogenase [Verminephrobacter eiseniae]MCW8222541.1 D-amino acid dehydrogenase [Verminephrobacter eiseniae]MCW8233524.1 D-amino acid dehydrogenase [Verminephrobacter eiseniae]
MKTVILGAGVVGVATAYYLAREGHEVLVIERQPEVARETSFANAGLVAPGHSYTWASPKAPGILLKSLFLQGQALRLKLRLDPPMWAWGLQFLRHCTTARWRQNTTRKLHLCRYSQQLLQALTAAERLEYQRTEGGALYIYRDAPALERGIEAMRVLSDAGLPLQTLTPGQLAQREPALADAQAQIAGAIFCPSDESGDARLFTCQLAQRCERMGVQFLMNRPIEGWEHSADRISAVRTAGGAVAGDHFVLALGSYSPILASRLGYRLPIYPVKGYSVTLPIRPGDQAPTLGGVDEHHLVAWARFGDRLRLTATAEFAGYDTGHVPQDFDGMLALARQLFPRGADYDRPEYWSCLRPMTPSGAPILGRTRHRNLFLNTGHGHMGWTMACGTARIVSDIICGRPPGHSLEGLTHEAGG